MKVKVKDLKTNSNTKQNKTRYYDPKTKIPVSTTMKCIMNMAAQYFIVYTLMVMIM